MLEVFKYINHNNEELEFGNHRLFVNENDLRDFSWDVTSKNNRISGFSKGIVKKTIPVVIKCDSEQEGIEIRNKLFETLEKDVLSAKHGKIVIGDYYMKCFVVGSTKSSYLFSNNYMVVGLKITTDFPFWIKETAFTFGGTSENPGTNLDFNRDAPWDYSSNILTNSLNNTSFIESEFKMVIYGQCSSPCVTIGGHDYEVDVEVGQGEYLTIDSSDKKIFLTSSTGQTTNCFNLRNKDSYIFKKIPSGSSNVAVNGDFVFDVILFDERSEPKWI